MLCGNRPAGPRVQCQGAEPTAAKALLLKHPCSRRYRQITAFPGGTESPLAPDLGHPP